MFVEKCVKLIATSENLLTDNWSEPKYTKNARRIASCLSLNGEVGGEDENENEKTVFFLSSFQNSFSFEVYFFFFIFLPVIQKRSNKKKKKHVLNVAWRDLCVATASSFLWSAFLSFFFLYHFFFCLFFFPASLGV